MKNVKDALSWLSFTRKYNKNEQSGVIKKFDDEFFAQFDGMYYDGLPIYFYLNPFYAEKKCFDASGVLGLAFDDCYICRGNLSSQNFVWGRGKTEHGWVEKDGVVYDTTWGIYCPADVYYKVFKPKNVNRRTKAKFFEDCKGLSDWTIRDKKWYEENFSIAKFLIWGARAIAETALKNELGSEEDKAFWRKLLNDLPDETKAKMPEIDFEAIVAHENDCPDDEDLISDDDFESFEEMGE